MSKRFFLESVNGGDINYCAVFNTREEAFTAVQRVFQHSVIDADKTIHLYNAEGKLINSLVAVEKNLDIFIAELGTGALLKAHFESPEKAIDFIYDTYDEVEWDVDNDIYHVNHHGMYIGSFEVLGGI